ncbi:MAG: hypothetical protein KDC61_14205 [Saprospiraceae bacterium]|nr:hypothetical protein [Saprospiraceae bacterium]
MPDHNTHAWRKADQVKQKQDTRSLHFIGLGSANRSLFDPVQPGSTGRQQSCGIRNHQHTAAFEVSADRINQGNRRMVAKWIDKEPFFKIKFAACSPMSEI